MKSWDGSPEEDVKKLMAFTKFLNWSCYLYVLNVMSEKSNDPGPPVNKV
jgi:hypothetical protein